jgi:NADH-quinone oxidoreductase subunit I
MPSSKRGSTSTTGRHAGDLYYTKPMLLANGDRYEAQIAEDRELDSKYR